MGATREIGRRTQWWTPPKYPDATDRVQSLTHLYSNPCNVPWIVYVETALPALGLALLEYMDFGVMDVVRGFAKPAQAGRRSHGSRRNRARRRMPGLPDLGDEIGKKLRPDAFWKRTLSDGQRHLWMAYGGIERALWWWMVADIGLNFGYNWASAIYAEEYCSRSSDYRGARQSGAFFTLFPNRDEGMSGGQVLYWDPPPAPSHSWACRAPAGWTLHAMIGGSYTPDDPKNPPQGVEIGFRAVPLTNLGRPVATTGQLQEDGTHMVAAVSTRTGAGLYPFTRYAGGSRPRWDRVIMSWYASPL